MKHLTVAFALLVSLAPLARAQHWITRPQDWGKNGVILFPPQSGEGSGLAVDSPGHVGSDGVVYGPTSNTSVTPQTWQAAVRHDAQGLASYYDPRGVVPGQVRAPAHLDRRVSEPGPTLGQTAPSIRVIDGQEYLWRDGEWVKLAPKPRPSASTPSSGQPLGQTANSHYEFRNGRWVLVK